MSNEMRVGYTPGVWDVFHPGHLAMLRRARRYCDYLIVGVCGDDLVNQHKGHYPIISEDHRYDLIDSLCVTDLPLIYKDERYIQHIKNSNADVFIVSEDFGKQGVDAHLNALAWCNETGVEVVKIPRIQVPGLNGYFSSTALREVIE